MPPQAPVPAVRARVRRGLVVVMMVLVQRPPAGPDAPARKHVHLGRGPVVVVVVAVVVGVAVVLWRAVAVVVRVVVVRRRARVVVGRGAVPRVRRRRAVGMRGPVGGGGRGRAHGRLEAHGDHAPRHVRVVGRALDGHHAVGVGVGG